MRPKQRSGALHVTQKIDYGLILMTSLAKDKNQVSIKKIAEEGNVSFLFLQKIASVLQKAGIITAERGKFGGYSLNGKLKDYTLGQIIEVLEGPIAITPCLNSLNKVACRRVGFCPIRPKFAKINKEIQELLATKTLDNFIS